MSYLVIIQINRKQKLVIYKAERGFQETSNCFCHGDGHMTVKLAHRLHVTQRAIKRSMLGISLRDKGLRDCPVGLLVASATAERGVLGSIPG